MSLRLGTLSEPLTSCIRAFNRASRVGGFTWGDTVVIQGSGPIGILAIAAALEMGAGRVIMRRRAGKTQARAVRENSVRRRPSTSNKFTTPEARIQKVRDIVGGFGGVPTW